MTKIKANKKLALIWSFCLVILLILALVNREVKKEKLDVSESEKEIVNVGQPEDQWLEENLENQSNGHEKECNLLGGKYLIEHNECEQISEIDCQKLGGEYVGCGSACRHNPDPTAMCMMVCVSYCKW